MLARIRADAEYVVLMVATVAWAQYAVQTIAELF